MAAASGPASTSTASPGPARTTTPSPWPTSQATSTQSFGGQPGWTGPASRPATMSRATMIASHHRAKEVVQQHPRDDRQRR